jgi:hypothetical protein
MDYPAKRRGTLFLMRRPRARISPRPDCAAAALCSPRAGVLNRFGDRDQAPSSTLRWA